MILPAYLVRVGIDSARCNPEFNNLNPCARCRQGVKIVSELFEEQIGATDSASLEPAVITAYFAEFFHAAQPAAGEAEWKDVLTKESQQHSSFSTWEEWFTSKYAQLYEDDNFWIAFMMTGFAYTHQYELVYTEDAWEFKSAAPYFPTEQLWRLEPHLDTTADILHKIWREETDAYHNSGFNIDDYKLPYFGKPECLGFDTRQYRVIQPSGGPCEDLDAGMLIADIIAPVENGSGYRKLDSTIFTGNHLDVTSLINRAQYFFAGRRRLYELSIGNDQESAIIRAVAEGWLAYGI